MCPNVSSLPSLLYINKFSHFRQKLFLQTKTKDAVIVF
jgi:hypothetical protein